MTELVFVFLAALGVIGVVSIVVVLAERLCDEIADRWHR